MDFNELIGRLIDGNIAEFIGSFLAPIASIVLSMLYARVKTKLYAKYDSTAKLMETIVGIKDAMAKQVEENKVLKEEQVKMVELVTSLGSMVGIFALDAKSISPEAKLAISKTVGLLSDHGLDLKEANKYLVVANDVANVASVAVQEAKEIMETVAKEEIATVEAVSDDALAVYNDIASINE
jgi:hypothetical protein